MRMLCNFRQLEDSFFDLEKIDQIIVDTKISGKREKTKCRTILVLSREGKHIVQYSFTINVVHGLC